MAGNVVQALLRLTGDASSALRSLRAVEDGLRDVQSAGKTLQSVGGSMTKFVTLPILAAGGAAGKMALDFDQAMRGVNTVVKAGEKEFQQMKKDVLDLSTTTSRSSVEVAEAFKFAASSGLEAADANEVLEHSLDAASNMGSEATTVIRAVTKTIQAFGLEASDTVHVLDVLQTAATKSSAEFGPLVDHFSKVSGIAAAAKIPFEEVAAAIMSASDAGYNMAEATTALARLIQALIDPSDELLEMFRSWGYESGEAALAGLGFVGVMQRIDQETGGSAAALSEILPNIRAMRGAFALTGGNADLFAESLDEVGRASEGVGEHMKLVEERHRSLNYKIQRTKSYVEVLAIRIGTSYIPVLDDVIERLKGWAESAANMSDRNLRLVTTIGAVAAAAGPAIWALGSFLRALGTIVSTARTVQVVLVNAKLAMQAYAAGASAAEVASLGLAGKLGLMAAKAAAAAGPVAVLAGFIATSNLKAREFNDESKTLIDRLEILSKMFGQGGAAGAAGLLGAVIGQKLTPKLRELLGLIVETDNALEGAGWLPDVGKLAAGQMADYAEMGKHAAEQTARAAWAAREAGKALLFQGSAAEAAEMAEEELQRRLSQIKTLLAEPVRKANEEYLQTKGDILVKIREEEERLAELQRKHGMVVGSQEDLVIAQAQAQTAAGRLAEAQSELAENTDPEVQLQLEAAVARAEQAVGRANSAVESAGPHHLNYRKEIEKSRKKVEEWRGELEEAAKAHRTHLENIALDMLEAQLAADGWTKEEVEAYQEILAGMGRLDEGAAEMLDTVTEAADGITEGTMGAKEAQDKLEESAVRVQEKLVTERLAADSAHISTRNLGDASDDASWKMDNLAGSAETADGKLDGAYVSALNLKGAMDGLPDRKDIDIHINVHRPEDVGEWFNLHFSTPTFFFQDALENLAEFAQRNPIKLGLEALGAASRTAGDVTRGIEAMLSPARGRLGVPDLRDRMTALGGATYEGDTMMNLYGMDAAAVRILLETMQERR